MLWYWLTSNQNMDDDRSFTVFKYMHPESGFVHSPLSVHHTWQRDARAGRLRWGHRCDGPTNVVIPRRNAALHSLKLPNGSITVQMVFTFPFYMWFITRCNHRVNPWKILSLRHWSSREVTKWYNQQVKSLRQSFRSLILDVGESVLVVWAHPSSLSYDSPRFSQFKIPQSCKRCGYKGQYFPLVVSGFWPFFVYNSCTSYLI